MNKKYTYEEVARVFKEKGCELLEEGYINAHHPMKHRCKCGEIVSVSWHNFRKRSGCANCNGTKKLKLIDVAKAYEDNGCKLLERSYTSATTPMKFKCKCGNIHQKPYYTFKEYPFCNNCGKTCRLNHKDVCDYYKKHGCELLDEYNRNSVPMRFRCKCGKVTSKSFQNFKISKQCSQCSEKCQYTLNEVKNIFLKGGCELLESNYDNVKTKMRYRCKCEKTSKISLEKFMFGRRCKECGIRRGESNGRWNPDRELVRLNALIASRSLSHLKHILKLQGKKKELKAKSYLGYSVSELRDRITSHPNWEKVKNEKWHIDHIFPIKAFVENGITDLKIINALDNLQPLSEFENLSKSDKYNKKQFKLWIKSKGVSYE